MRGGISEGVMLWMAAAELAVLKRSSQVLVARCLCSMTRSAARKVVLHSVQSLAVTARPSKSGRCFRKLPTERREEDVMATSQLSVIGMPERVTFFCESFILLMYSGMQGSLFQKSIICLMRETLAVASIPPLPKVTWLRSWRRSPYCSMWWHL